MGAELWESAVDLFGYFGVEGDGKGKDLYRKEQGQVDRTRNSLVLLGDQTNGTVDYDS